ncbi:hypothetical protein [Curtobacterium phage Penoan]|nr:hypothetical protein [Curtobacterium phage Penoan]
MKGTPVPYVMLTDPQVAALATYLQRQGFSASLPLDSRDPLANAAQQVMDTAQAVVHESRMSRRQTPGRTLQACGADMPPVDGYPTVCTLMSRHDGPHSALPASVVAHVRHGL